MLYDSIRNTTHTYVLRNTINTSEIYLKYFNYILDNFYKMLPFIYKKKNSEQTNYFSSYKKEFHTLTHLYEFKQLS